jgi:transposase
MVQKEGMSRFKPYSPDQAYLLPPSVKDELEEGHLCFFIQKVVERLDLSEFERAYGVEGGPLYAPKMMLSVWLYAYATGLTSARGLERWICEQLPLRYLAGGHRPDHWALSAFRRKHGRGINDVFTQVVEFTREQGLGKLGVVAVDSTSIKADNAKSRVDTEQRLRNRRARIRRQIRWWQKQCDAHQNAVVAELSQQQRKRLEQELSTIPARLQKLKKSGLKSQPRTDADCQLLHKRGKTIIGYKADIAVSEDHFIVAQRVSQEKTDNQSLQPMVEQVQKNCHQKPQKVVADSGFYSNDNVALLEKNNIDGFIPDSNMAAVLNKGVRLKGRAKAPEMKRMRAKLRTLEGRQTYGQRKAIVEAPFGTIKTQRDLARFRLRGKDKVAIEFTFSAIGFNLTRLQAELDRNSPLWQRRRLRGQKHRTNCCNPSQDHAPWRGRLREPLITHPLDRLPPLRPKPQCRLLLQVLTHSLKPTIIHDICAGDKSPAYPESEFSRSL